MTNQEIDRLIERNQKNLRIGSFTVPIISGIFVALTFALATLSAFSELAAFAMVGTFLCALVCISVTFDEIRHWRSRSRKGTLAVWQLLQGNRAFGDLLTEATRRLDGNVRKIYDLDTGGEIFPLRQSIRLNDTHNRQQQRLQIVEHRLRELRLLQESLAGKMNQLRELGEDYPQGTRNLEQINGDLEALGRVHGQIHASCTRLEAIVIGVQKAVQAQQLHRELDDLSSRLPATPTVEPEFDAASLEEIERQIGREIETYLRLERETDEHLREL